MFSCQQRNGWHEAILAVTSESVSTERERRVQGLLQRRGSPGHGGGVGPPQLASICDCLVWLFTHCVLIMYALIMVGFLCFLTASYQIYKLGRNEDGDVSEKFI